MPQYTESEVRLIICSDCSEMVAVPIDYDGNLCDDCRAPEPYGMYGNPSMKQTVKSLRDRALIYWRWLVTANTQSDHKLFK